VVAAAECNVWNDEQGSHATSGSTEVPVEVLRKYTAAAPVVVSKPKTEVASDATPEVDPNNIVFRGMPWGSRTSEYMDLVLLETGSDHTKFYSRKGDNLSINGAELFRIEYGFFDDRLFAVIIGFKGDLNFNKIYEALDQNYGDRAQPNPLMDRYLYCMRCDTSLMLDYSKILGNGTLSYRYNPISDEVVQFEKERAKKAKKDL
jgi:hypothetical protein